MSAGRSSEKEPYSAKNIRNSLHIFAVGKAASGLIGFAWMLLLVRMLDVSSYGGYVILLALLEIILLVSNGGVFSIVQRYITEARLPQNIWKLPKVIWWSLTYRISTLILAAICITWFASPISQTIRQFQLEQVLPIYAFTVIFEGSARYLELVFEAMLEQGKAQICAVIRNGFRLVLVLFSWYSHKTTSLTDIIRLEASTAGLGLAFSIILIFITIQKIDVNNKNTNQADFSLKRITQFALPHYFAQCLTQVYSPDTIKLIISRLLGVAEAANFGFAHALSFVMQRYLPATLLIGLIRPMLVARRSSGGQDANAYLVQAGNLVLKINLLLLLPIAAIIAATGRSLTELASGGKFGDSASLLLLLLSLLLVLIGFHVVLSTLAIAIENRYAVLAGTIVSLPGVFLGILLSTYLGSLAMVLGLWASEILWCIFTWNLLRKSGFNFILDWRGSARIATAATASAGIAWIMVNALSAGPVEQTFTAFVSIAAIYPLLCHLLKPFTSMELAMLTKLLPTSLQ